MEKTISKLKVAYWLALKIINHTPSKVEKLFSSSTLLV